jgi:hypothetical protein
MHYSNNTKRIIIITHERYNNNTKRIIVITHDVSLILESQFLANVFPYNIKFEIYDRPFPYL